MRTSRLKHKVVKVTKITRIRMENRKRTKAKLALNRKKRKLIWTLVSSVSKSSSERNSRPSKRVHGWQNLVSLRIILKYSISCKK